MPVTQEDLTKKVKEIKEALEKAAATNEALNQDATRKRTFNQKIRGLRDRVDALSGEFVDLTAAALPPNAADAPGLEAVALPQATLEAQYADAQKIKEDCDKILTEIPPPNPYATTVEGTNANPDIPDHTVEVTATTGDKLTIKYTKGKASISIPSTDSMTLAQKIQLARNMTYFALKAGAYETDEDGNITFIIRSPDSQLRTALEETVKSLGFKFKTPEYSSAARNQAHSAAADQTGFFAPISGTELMMDPVARAAAKIAGIITDLNLRSSTRYQEKLQAIKENKILQDAIASVTDISLKEKRIKREKTSDEILEQIQINTPLYQKIKQELDDYMARLQPPPPAKDTGENAKLAKLYAIVDGLIQSNSTTISRVDQLLENPKQTEILSRAGFLQEFEQGFGQDYEIAIKNFKKSTIAGQVFQSQLLRLEEPDKLAEKLFAKRSKSPVNSGKLDSMAKDGVGKANEYEEQMKPDEIKTATADPKAMAKSLTATGRSRHAAQPKPSNPAASASA